MFLIKIITLNVRGIGVEGKIGWIKSIIRDEHPDVIGLQETKIGSIKESWVEEDVNIFVCKEAIEDERFIALSGDWKWLAGLMERKSSAWCIFGDFNVVRRLDDRLNSQVNVKDMDEFNEFIKMDLKAWSKNRFGAHDEKLEEYKQEALKWELEAENRHLSDIEMES
ncbi:RNA-directed DNA polymerase, eukaryota [Tanacetum coccineum]